MHYALEELLYHVIIFFRLKLSVCYPLSFSSVHPTVLYGTVKAAVEYLLQFTIDICASYCIIYFSQGGVGYHRRRRRLEEKKQEMHGISNSGVMLATLFGYAQAHCTTHHLNRLLGCYDIGYIVQVQYIRRDCSNALSFKHMPYICEIPGRLLSIPVGHLKSQ